MPSAWLSLPSVSSSCADLLLLAALPDFDERCMTFASAAGLSALPDLVEGCAPFAFAADSFALPGLGEGCMPFAFSAGLPALPDLVEGCMAFASAADVSSVLLGGEGGISSQRGSAGPCKQPKGRLYSKIASFESRYICPHCLAAEVQTWLLLPLKYLVMIVKVTCKVRPITRHSLCQDGIHSATCSIKQKRTNYDMNAVTMYTTTCSMDAM